MSLTSRPVARESRWRFELEAAAGRAAVAARRARSLTVRPGPWLPAVMRLELSRSVIRAWVASDWESLARHADSPRIAATLRDQFPSPYGLDDADRFIAVASGRSPQTSFAIEVDGEAAGGIGLLLHDGNERISAELGYWLGESCWGRGVMTEAVRAFTDWGFATFGLHRIYAVPYVTNPASARLLEKAGFVYEGRMRRSAIKLGQVLDQLLYADVR